MADDAGAPKKHCPKITMCPMFPLFRSRQVLRVFQIRYCESNFTECQRYQLATSGTMPDRRLLPDGGWLTED